MPGRLRGSARPLDLDAKRRAEGELVSQMIALYCRGHHGGGHAARVRLGGRELGLCAECEELRAYALARIASCPRMADKTFCSACPTHCYRPQMRERIREVMRWSGPRMLRHRPVVALRHALSTLRSRLGMLRLRR